MGQLKFYCIAFFIIIFSTSIYSQKWEVSNVIKGNNLNPSFSAFNNGNTYMYGEFRDTIFNSDQILAYGNKDLFLTKINEDGSIAWFKTIGGLNNDIASGISIYNNEIYIGGNFSGTIYLSASDSLTSSGSNDFFLAKYNTNGLLLWYKKMSASSTYESLKNIKFDLEGNLLLVGFFLDSLVIGNCPNCDTIIGTDKVSNFIAKADINGNIIWSKDIIGNHNATRISRIEINHNSYYFGGSYIGKIFFDKDTLESLGNYYDNFIYKTDLSGNENWVRNISGTSIETFRNIRTDVYGNLYVLGNYSSSTLYVDSTQNVTVEKVLGTADSDPFIGKYNKSGNLQWFISRSSAGKDIYMDFSVIGDVIYATGFFTNQLIFNQDTITTSGSSNEDAFLAAFNSIGDPISGTSIKGTGDFNDASTIVQVDNDVNAYISGFYNSLSIEIGDSNYTNIAEGNQSLFFAKYSHPFEAVFTSESNVTCNGSSDGMLTTTPYFGVPPYTYSWSHNPGLNDSVATNLSAGIYTVTITDSRDSTAIGTATVSQPQPMDVAFSITNTTCFNGNDGALDITVTGGNNGYDYTWDGGVGLEPKEEDQTGLYAGTYYLTVTDQKGCTKLDTVEISQPDKILFNPSVTPSGEGLSNGAIDLAPTGGNPPYNFSWTGPSAFTAATEDVTGLAGGTYNVTITHDASCSVDTSIFVPEENQFQIYISNVEHISCHGASDGSASVSVENPTGLLAYTWYDSTKVNIVSEFAAAANLDSGKYYVRVEDEFPHVAWDSVVIQQPDSLYFSRFFRSQVQCNGENTGYIDVEIDGGTPVYTYQWAHGPTSENLTGLAASDTYYKVTVTDANGCTAVDSGLILEPDPVLVSINKQDPLCPNTLTGTATANASGGVQPYDYVWNDPGNQTEQQATALPAGNFTVTVTDFAGCIETASVSLNDPTPVQITNVDVTNINCHGADNGTVSVDVTGGTGAYGYTWNHSAENSSTATGLAPGDYSVIVTDANNCTPDTAFATISEPDTVIIDISTTQIDCHGQEEGEILVSASGGSGSFTYEWGHTASGFSELGGLAAGTYNLTVSDGQCAPFEYNIDINQPQEISVYIDTANTTCYGVADGEISLQVTGGTGNYTYSWSHSPVDTNRFTNVTAGNYSVTISDGACPPLTFSNIQVTQPDSFYITSVDTSNISEFGALDGSITVNVSGGIPPLRYSLNGGTVRESNTFNDLSPGIYNVVVNDANQCGPISTGPLELTEPPSGIAGIWKSDELTMFPNPARDAVYLRFHGLQENEVSIRMVNMLGETVFERTFNDVLQHNELEINTERLNVSTYFIIINNKRAPHPLIIH